MNESISFSEAIAGYDPEDPRSRTSVVMDLIGSYVHNFGMHVVAPAAAEGDQALDSAMESYYAVSRVHGAVREAAQNTEVAMLTNATDGCLRLALESMVYALRHEDLSPHVCWAVMEMYGTQLAEHGLATLDEATDRFILSEAAPA